MKNILLYLWQLPQNLIGLLVIKFGKTKFERMLDDVTYLYSTTEPYGVSLGNYIILDTIDREKDVKHEYGHHKQSLILGWFYLLIIGLPSVVGNLLCRVFWYSYYSQPWEAWADKLGGVERC